jgi:hypothetical protein
MTIQKKSSRHAHAGNSSRQRTITRVLIVLSILLAVAAIYMGVLGVQALASW